MKQTTGLETTKVWRIPAKYVAQSFPRHTHQRYAIGVIEDGALGFYYRGENVVASKGSINLCIPGEVHTGYSASEAGWAYRMFNKVVGIALAVCGVLLINVLGRILDTGRGTFSLYGNILIFGAVVGEALFTIFRKLSSNIISPLRTATLMSLLGLAMFFPFALYESVQFDFSKTTILDWTPVFYYGIVVTVIAFILWFQGVTKVSASVAAVFTGIMPVSAVLLSYIILGESFAWSHLWGGLCVLAGIGFIVHRS